jgi:hypothetical protein
MRFPLLPLTLLCVAGLTGMPAHAENHTSHHLPDAARHAAPTTGQGWGTDVPLREGMQDVRAAVDALGHYEHGHMGPEQAVVLAEKIESDVRDIIANCKLAPDADAALHAIIVPLMQNAGALKREPHKLEAIAPMRQALEQYARQFDDPGAVPTE